MCIKCETNVESFFFVYKEVEIEKLKKHIYDFLLHGIVKICPIVNVMYQKILALKKVFGHFVYIMWKQMYETSFIYRDHT